MLPEYTAAIEHFAEYAVKSAFAATMRNIVFSSPQGGDALKIKGVLRLIGGNRAVQLESSLTEGRVSQENISPEVLSETIGRLFPKCFSRVDLNDEAGSASLMISKKGKVTAVIPGALRKSLDGSVTAEISAVMERFAANDRVKNRVLSGQEPFLKELGISDSAGRVHDKRQAKFRQICRFSELVLEALPHLPAEGTLYIADLCCGKSYLSFAVYHCLRFIAGRDVEMICIDLKQSVMDYCAECAQKLGYAGMKFMCADITAFTPPRAPDMVISLHACDTATDIVLDFAARHRASVILSTPCCQRELNRKLSCSTLSFIADRPALRRKFCDAATDALRLSRLECMGYTADALEFIDPEDTPKNIMLRAYLRPRFSPTSLQIQKLREQYAADYRFLCGEDPLPFPE